MSAARLSIAAVWFAALTLGSVGQCADWYVNSVAGNDAFDGRSPEPAGDGKKGPFASIAKAFDSVGVSDRIEVANTGKPYDGGDPRRGGNLLSKAGGTPERPLVIEGNGATITGLGQVPKEKWRVVRDRIVATDFWPMSNGLKRDRKIMWWIGVPRIWWLDGEAAPNCTSEEELDKTPGGFFWNKKAKADPSCPGEVWVHLPAGKKLEDVKIEIPARGTCMCICTSYVVVNNFRAILSWNDGFDTHGAGKHIVYKNCLAVDCCGQGFSVHDTNSVIYEDCLAERCASAGIGDANFCTAAFRRCVVVNNTFDGGIGMYENSQHTFEDCLIVGNTPFEQIRAANRAHANFFNCVILAKQGDPSGILGYEYGGASNASVLFWQCTIADAPYVCKLPGRDGCSLSIQNCILTRCKECFLSIHQEARGRVSQQHNVCFDGPGNRFGDTLYGEADLSKYLTVTGVKDLFWQDPRLEGQFKVNLPKDSPLHKMGRRYTIPIRIGAELPASVWELYNRTRGEYGTPDGIRKTDKDLMSGLRNTAAAK